METVIKLDNVSFLKNDKIILENINLDIKRGDYIGVVGANSAGKSTLLRLIINEKKATEGEIFLFGQRIEEFNKWYKMNYMNQKSHSFRATFPMTVKEFISTRETIPRNLSRKLGLYRHNKNRDIIELEKILKEVEFLEYKNKVIKNLKIVQNHNFFLCNDIIDYPKVLIIDEPVVGISDDEKKEFYYILNKLNLDYNITIIIASHDISVISKVAKKIIAIKNHEIREFNNECVDTKKILDYLYHDNVKEFV